MLELLSSLFGFVIRQCYAFTGNYILAIVMFTVLTKVVLFPMTLWMHRNGIRMVELTPELNRLKIKYYGDRDTVAEETQTLYKARHYHPLAGMIPMIIQLIILAGVIGAVRELLAGTDSIYSLYPSQQGGYTLLMPVAAGLAALALGFSQNHLNPLQREQPLVSQWMTNGISIAISLVLGAFVPIGVGVYWITGNLLTIVQQVILNAVMPARRYVDYKALKESRKELESIDKLSVGVSKEDKRREKEDYKRFFSVANKHLVFYSESSGFYKYFQAVIEYLLAHSNVIIHYITSDPKDQIFEIAKQQPHIRAYYIGENRLITLMMKMDADIVVMTMPDLDNFHIKRSYVRKDIEYVYINHGLYTGLITLRDGALDHFDTLLMPTPGGMIETKAYNKWKGIPDQNLVPCGYGLIDQMAASYESMEKIPHTVKTVLIAPSWQPENVIESCLHDIAQQLLAEGYDITVRPHPQYIRRFPQNLQKIMVECSKYPKERFRFQLDFSSNESVFLSDVLITDWSNIGYEYALATKKPVVFINTPRKVVNEKWAEEGAREYHVDADIRSIIGFELDPGDVKDKISSVAKEIVTDTEKWEQNIELVRQERLFHFGESGKYGAKYLLSRLKELQTKTDK